MADERAHANDQALEPTDRIPALRAVNDTDFVLADDEVGRRPSDYGRTLWRYRWSILSLALVAAVIGGLTALSATPIYRADVKLLVKFSQPNFTTVQQFESTPMYWLFYETQYQIVGSRAIAEKVVDALDLEKGVAAAPPSDAMSKSSEPAWLTSLRASLPEWRDWVPVEWRPQEPKPLTGAAKRAAAVAGVLGGLNVKGGKESEIIRISYTSGDPERAARIANAVADAYIAFGLETRSSSVQETSSWLSERLDELRNKFRESEGALQDFQKREGMVDSESREKLIGAKLGSLTAELINAQARRGESEARYRKVREIVDGGLGYEPLLALLNNPLVLEAYRSKAEIERRLSELGERYGEKHPKMVSGRADQREAERYLDVEVQKAVDRLRQDFEVASSQQAQLQGIIEQQQVQVRGLSGKAFELARLERDVEANRQLYEAFLTRFKEADVANNYDMTNVRIIDPAQVPAAPFKPNKRRIITLALIGGLLLGVVLAFLREHLDNTFKTKEDVEDRLNLPVLGVLQRLKLRLGESTPERYMLDEPRSPFAEAVNDVRTAILFSDVDNPPKVILITSAVAGEGKTTLASNLALAFRQRGRTLLLDADLRKGRLKDFSGDTAERGLTDVVSGECVLMDAVIADADAENMDILTAGTSPPNPLEIISSQRFARCLEALRNAYDYIIVDASPLLPVSDSIVLARSSDCVVFAVQAERTTQPMAQDALKRLGSARIKPVGVVMQQVDVRQLKSYYGKRYSYLYGDHYGYSKASTS